MTDNLLFLFFSIPVALLLGKGLCIFFGQRRVRHVHFVGVGYFLMGTPTVEAMKKTREECRIFVKSLIVIVLVSMFVLHVYDQVIKFFERKTTMAFSIRNEQRLYLPSLSICPGYKSVPKDENLTFPYDRFVKEEHRSRKEMEMLWSNITFGLDEFITSIGFFHPYEPSDSALWLGDNLRTNENILIKRVETTFGKCYLFKAKVPVPPHKSINYELNIRKLPSPVSVFVHEDFSEIGLFNNFWPTPIHFYKIYPGQIVGLVLEKQEYHLQKDKCDDTPKYQFSRCVRDWAQLKMMNLTLLRSTPRRESKDNCAWMASPCWLPQFNYLMEGMDLEPCLDVAAKQCMSDHMQGNVISLLEGHSSDCKPNCKEVTYQVQRRDDVYTNPRGIARLSVMYNEARVYVYEEYLLLDAGAIVAAVGGSLGLFLGLSVLDCARFCCWRLFAD